MFYSPSFRFSLILASVSGVAEPDRVVLTAESEVVFEPESIFEPEVAFEPQGILEPEVVFEPEAVFEPEVVFEPRDIFEPEVVFEPQGILEPEVVFEPEAVFEPEVAFVVSADVAGPQASVDIAIAFAVLVPVSGVVVEADSSGHPKFLVFPNVDHYASYSSSGEAGGKEFVRSSTGAHTNHGLCSILSNPGLHQNKKLGYCYNNSNPGHNNMSDTKAPPIDATTNHSRKICPHLRREQRRHRPCPVSLSPQVVRQIRWAVAKKFQNLCLHLPLLE